ncbi:hypothetical protein [Actinacidiphila glaucinigra]|uniref:Uncharacterized protein n=1 Tax=Actinacidiphila glaucinigra TaxID=235986 RepID=A0A239JJ69_9ACTN|nr:hypothetical protein [Actinacidiphila glaucinigra]SNT05458.1 hypothetical protein SAMN05216252_11346 [Actinacidiphila glaucinigra]
MTQGAGVDPRALGVRDGREGLVGEPDWSVSQRRAVPAAARTAQMVLMWLSAT